MIEIFKLIKQLPRPRKITVNGYLSIDRKTNQATFWTLEETINATMERIKLIFANSEGMLLTGFEPNGIDKNGRAKYKYQEWYLVFLKN